MPYFTWFCVIKSKVNIAIVSLGKLVTEKCVWKMTVYTKERK